MGVGSRPSTAYEWDLTPPGDDAELAGELPPPQGGASLPGNLQKGDRGMTNDDLRHGPRLAAHLRLGLPVRPWSPTERCPSSES
jgi:hypothetical protein